MLHPEENINLVDFKLPKPDTRLVVFGDAVFKLKYKMSGEPTGAEKLFCKSPQFQESVKKLTAAVLHHFTKTKHLIPIKTDNVVLFPGSHPWTVADTLMFTYNRQELHPYPDVLLLLVHLIPSPSPPQEPSEDTVSEHTAGCPEDEQLPLMTGVPSANVLARKTLKQKGEESYGTPRENPQVPGDGAAMPSGSVGGGERQSPSQSVVLQEARASKQRLHALSQPDPLDDPEPQPKKKRSGWFTSSP